MSDNIDSQLGSLSTEILLVVFSKLSLSDLANLQRTCRRFYTIIDHYWDIIIFKRREQFLVTNQCDECFQKRSRKLRAIPERHRISNNWQIGRYTDSRTVIGGSTPDFHLDRDSIWLGTKSCISLFKRLGNKIIKNRSKYSVTGLDFSDICKFSVDSGRVSVVNGKKLQLHYPQNGRYKSKISVLNIAATCVDMQSNLIAVGSREGCVKLFKDSTKLRQVTKLRLKDRVWTVALNGDRIAIGTAANISRTCIALADTTTGESLQVFQAGIRGAGVLQLKWESPNMLWSGGYDMYLKRYDLRINQCVQKFLDPWASKINCFDWDAVNTAITGCDNSRATLWDLRDDSSYVQMYFVESRSRCPIRCLSFDAEYLYAATDKYFNILDFSTMNRRTRDYSDMFCMQLVI